MGLVSKDDGWRIPDELWMLAPTECWIIAN